MTRTRTLATFASFGTAIALVVAGPVMVVKGLDAKDQVRAELTAERITTPEDASIPNAPVVDAETALSQADVIKKHALETSKGKTYAELDREDPARQTLFNAATLRTALLSSVLAWNVANLVIGLGMLLTALSAVFLLIGLALRKPESVYLAAPTTRIKQHEAL